MASPSFPPPALVEKALELGFGSGPWNRADLSQRWGASSANKFIADAKEAGWLVSPLINTFYVLPARDLMLVSWLTGLAKKELVLSRALTAAGFRSWCLSEWARGVGIETGDALLVTDLEPVPEKPPRASRPQAPPVKELADRNRSIAGRIRTLPFLDNVILVPFLPQSSRVRKSTRVVLPGGSSKQVTSWNIENPGIRETDRGAGLKASAMDVRSIPYAVSPEVDDPAWVLACIRTLDLPFFNEVLPTLIKKQANAELLGSPKRWPLAERLLTWSGLFAPPEPNANWRKSFESGRSQYLLVPSSLWALSASISQARRYREIAPKGTNP